jgi:YHS domain-containing protein
MKPLEITNLERNYESLICDNCGKKIKDERSALHSDIFGGWFCSSGCVEEYEEETKELIQEGVL